MKNIEKMLDDSIIFFDAIQTAGNEAVRSGGYNRPHQLTEHISVTYELYEFGPEARYLTRFYPEGYGDRIDLDEENHTDHDAIIRRMNAYHRIVFSCNGETVFIFEGKEGLQMSYGSKDHSWEEELLNWYQVDKGGKFG